ncbi:hypothetical protein [Streptococcus parasanguinis]|uniref:hypothetical protein n=1 Tax=Streptococcus parasanguinis TaxID=1318 RepID=UPI00352BEE27
MKKSIFKASFEESLNLEDDGFLQYQLKEQNKKVSNPPSNIFGYFKNALLYSKSDPVRIHSIQVGLGNYRI